MPLELVLPPAEASNTYEEIEYAGAKVMIEKISEEQCRIVRIISSNPADYLRADIQPGVSLTYRPALQG